MWPPTATPPNSASTPKRRCSPAHPNHHGRDLAHPPATTHRRAQPARTPPAAHRLQRHRHRPHHHRPHHHRPQRHRQQRHRPQRHRPPDQPKRHPGAHHQLLPNQIPSRRDQSPKDLRRRPAPRRPDRPPYATEKSYPTATMRTTMTRTPNRCSTPTNHPNPCHQRTPSASTPPPNPPPTPPPTHPPGPHTTTCARHPCEPDRRTPRTGSHQRKNPCPPHCTAAHTYPGLSHQLWKVATNYVRPAGLQWKAHSHRLLVDALWPRPPERSSPPRCPTCNTHRGSPGQPGSPHGSPAHPDPATPGPLQTSWSIYPSPSTGSAPAPPGARTSGSKRRSTSSTPSRKSSR